MTIEQTYLEENTADVSHKVLIGATEIQNIQTIQWDYGIAQVPTCTLTLNEVPQGAVAFNAQVRVEVGFNGTNRRVFTGRVIHIDPNERNTVVTCQGYSLWLDVNYHEIILTFQNVTSEAAITDLLDASGVPAYNVNVPAWTIGTQELSPNPEEEQFVTLSFETYGEAILKIGEPDRCRWFETPTGTIIVRNTQPIPSLTPWRTYHSMQLDGIDETLPTGGNPLGRSLLRTVSVAHQLREVKNKVIVQGVTYTQVNADGSESPIDIEARVQADSPWVLNFNGTQAYNDLLFPHELIDTVEKAQEVAGTLCNELNRLNDRITIVVDGDPEIELGRTIEIIDPDYSRVNGRYFVEAYSTVLNVSGQFTTTITALGGSEAGGTLNIAPFALFTWALDREVIGDRVWAVGTLDAGGSFDGDGTIVSYAWSGDVTGTGVTLHFRLDPTVVGDTATVTLTVTDNDGETDQITLEIPLTAGQDNVFIPALFVAGDTHFSASPDGGITWYDESSGGESVVVAAGKPPNGVDFGTGWYGTLSGKIYLTTDYCQNPLQLVLDTGGASQIAHIWPDITHAGWVWACTRDARIYKSELDGVAGSWFLFEDLRTKLSLPGAILSRLATPPPDGIWAYGGTGTGCPLIAVDPTKSHLWNVATLGGELAADIGCGGGSGVDAAIYVHEVDGGRLAVALDSAPTDWSLAADSGVLLSTMCRLSYRGGAFFRLNTHGSSNETGTDQSGQLERSTDGGATWQALGPSPVQDADGNWWGAHDYDFAADGQMYVSYDTHDLSNAVDAIGVRVYRVADPLGAATFTLIYSDDETTFASNVSGRTSIACHPTDAGIVAVSYQPVSGNTRVAYSSNADEASPSFTKNTSTGMVGGLQMEITDSGAIVAVDKDSASDANIYRSTNQGATFSSVQVMDNSILGRIKHGRGAPGSHTIFVSGADGVGSDGDIYRSKDDGATWVNLVKRPITDNGAAWQIHYEPTNDTLYWITNSGVPTHKVFRLRNASTVGALSGTEEDISGDLDPAVIGDNLSGITVVPGVTVGDPTLRIAEAASREGGELAIILESAAHVPAVYFTPTVGVPESWRRAVGAPAKPHGRWITPETGPNGIGKFQFAFDDNIVYLGDVSGDTIAVSTAAAALDAADDSNHSLALGAFLPGIDGAHLVAAEGTVDGTIYKTWNRFASIGKLRPATGFPAPPAGWNAKFLAIAEGQLGPTGLDERLVALGTDVSPREQSRLIGVGADWDAPIAITGLTVAHPQIKPVTALDWYALNASDQIDTLHNTGAGRVSADGGDTWGAATAPAWTNGGWADIARGANGRIWGLSHDGSSGSREISKVWYWNGAAWVLSDTNGDGANNTRLGWRLLPHPSNPNILAYPADVEDSLGFLRGMIRYTLNAMDAVPTWSENIANHLRVGQNTFAALHALMLPNNRIVAFGPFDIVGPQTWLLYITDDFGATFTNTFSATPNSGIRRALGLWRNVGGDKVAALVAEGGTGQDVQLWRSLNAGASFSQVTISGDELVDFVVAKGWGGSFTPEGFAMSPERDAMYLTIDPSGATNKVVKLSPISGSPSWQDITGSFPHANQGTMNLAVVPIA